MRHLQNRIAESGMTLPVAALLGILVWLMSGLVTKGLWPQLACFVCTVYLLVELSNQNALLRVRSRMVSSTFILLSCTACFLFSSLMGAIVQLCFVASFLLLFMTYQDSQAVGRAFYAFVCLGLSSAVFVQTLWYVPLMWLLMATQLQSLSWRVWLASLIGLVTPYWFMLLWFIYQQDFTPLELRFAQLVDISSPVFGLTPGMIASYALVAVLSAVGIVHFWCFRFDDKIRIRLLYGIFITLTVFTLTVIILQPQHYETLMRLCFLFASPLIAHVLTLTNSRLSNILFFVVLFLVFLIISYNLYFTLPTMD